MADRLEGFGHRIEIGGVGGVRLLADIGEHHRNDVAGAVEKRYAAIGELGRVLRLENGVEAREIGIGQAFFHHVEIIGDADRAPHVGCAILVARIPALDDLEDIGVEILPVGQFRFIELLIGLGLEEALQGGAGLEDHVISGLAGHYLGFHRFR